MQTEDTIPQFAMIECPFNSCTIKIHYLGYCYLVQTSDGDYALLFSTDLEQDPEEILGLYRLRFQIEFVYRILG